VDNFILYPTVPQSSHPSHIKGLFFSSLGCGEGN
jgi:hypothetical protein